MPPIKERDRFYEIVRASWGEPPLFEGGGVPPERPPRGFDPWGRGWSFPSWAAVMVAFLLGFISANLLVLGPIWPAALLLATMLIALWTAVHGRWR